MRGSQNTHLQRNSEESGLCGERIPGSVKIVQTLSGASPLLLEHPPIVMTTYNLQPNSGHRNAPCPPTGDWWRKRGALFHVRNYFLQTRITGAKYREDLA